jgi:hypothetical protein
MLISLDRSRMASTRILLILSEKQLKERVRDAISGTKMYPECLFSREEDNKEIKY